MTSSPSECRILDRRAFLGLGLALAGGPAFAQPAPARTTAHAFTFPGIAGGTVDLSAFRGQTFMVVNAACQCGYTPQFEGLQRLWVRYRARGFTIVGVPSDDFGGQELDTEAEIAAFTQQQYGVGFPLTAKQKVLGPDAHPFFRWALRERPDDPPRWNFHKYLIGRDGLIAGVYSTQVRPDDPRLVAALERNLATA